jgi:hypothetical protein
MRIRDGKKIGSGIRITGNVPPGTAGVALDHLGEEAAHRRLGEQGSAALLPLLHTHINHQPATARACSNYLLTFTVL